MRILTIHANYIEFEATRKAFKGAEEDIEKGKKRVDECLVVFTAVEKRDEANPEAIVLRYLKEIKDVAAQVKAKTIVLYPYAHLSSNLSSPAVAEKIMKDAENILCKEKEYAVHRAPFGWYKAFTIANKGHPLSELSREFGPEQIVSVSAVSNEIYHKLIELLDKNKAKYRLIEHSPEGRTEIVSPMRGNKLSQAAKCIVVTIRTEKGSRHILAVVPGDAKVDLNLLKILFKGTYASFADLEIAEKLAGSVSGTILPFSFNPELELIVDPSLLKNEEIFFNAARLDRSLALSTSDYQKLAKPRLEKIAAYSEDTISNLKREHKDEPFQFQPKPLIKQEKILWTAAALLGVAIKELYPNAKIGSIGFHLDQAYIDIADVKITHELIPKVEKKVMELKKKAAPPCPLPLTSMTDSYALELATDVAKQSKPLQWGSAQFVPLMPDPYISINEIQAIKIMNIGSAYWKNNENNPQLSRLYCIAFSSEKELTGYLKQLEDAQNRSHLKIGKEMGLFVVSDLVGPGLPLLAPKGMIIRNEIIKFLWELHKDKGYQQVWTPHIAKTELYKTSGHWEKFGDELFKVKGKVDEFVMKPMNCPHHMQIYDAFTWSYRDLPIRFFEPGTIYRDEKSGQLVGLSRVRAITQDDGHLFCRKSQITQEAGIIVKIIHQFYHAISMDKNYWVSLSVRGEDRSKYLGTDEVWQLAESALEKAAKEHKLPYKRREGEAAFYGPKLDFMFKDALGREWQLATIQCDFNLPERFNLSYMNEEGKKERPVVIHRAISGSLERFMSILIEHFAGKFPVWLNPLQVKVLTITDKHLSFARKVVEKLQEKDIRVELDARTETMGKKIRDAQMEKANYMITIGDKEVEKEVLAIRTRDGKMTYDIPLGKFMDEIMKIVNERKN